MHSIATKMVHVCAHSCAGEIFSYGSTRHNIEVQNEIVNIPFSRGGSGFKTTQWVQASEGHAIGSIHNWAPIVLLLSFFIPQCFFSSG